MKKIYLDYAAATPVSEGCLEVMKPYFSKQFYNASATYLAAKAVKKSIEDARHSIASSIGVKPAEIIFTTGATEANNLAIQGVMESFPEANMITLPIEHESVLAPAQNYNTKLASVDRNGRLKLDDLKKLIDKQTVLISTALVNHELGTIQDIKGIYSILQQIRKDRSKNNITLPLYLHTDAAQAGCYFNLNAVRLGIDLMSVNGGKLYGPKQSGFLYIKTGTVIKPLILGGGQEYGIRSGTENAVAICGLAYAFTQAQYDHKSEFSRVGGMLQLIAKKLQQTSIDFKINSPAKNASPHILNITFTGCDNERLMMEMDEAGVMVALGSACSASSDKPSKVLTAIGLSDDDARSSLRLSFGRQTTQSDILKTIDTLESLLKA